MNRSLIRNLTILGAIMILAGVALPPERVVHALVPARAAAYHDTVVEGLKNLKVILLVDGLLLLMLRPLKRFLWDAKPAQGQLRPFYRQSNPGPLSGIEWMIFAGVTLLALGLRLHGARQSLFGDEIAAQQAFVSRGLPVIVTYFPPMAQHVLYSVLAYFFEKLPLPIELSYRLPAILAGVGAAALTYWVARRVFDRWNAAVVGVLAATAFYGITYSHNARGYTITECLAAVALVGVNLIVENWQRPRGWITLGGALTGLGYVHLYNSYLCIGLTTSCGLAILMAGWGRPPVVLACFKRYLWMLGIIGAILLLAYSLQLSQVIEQARRASSQPEEHLSLRLFRGWLMQLTFWGRFWPVSLTLLGLAIVGMISMARREPSLTLVLVLTPIILLSITALKESWIYPRYLVFTLLGFVILTVEGARVLGAWINRTAAQATVIAVAAVQLTCTGFVLHEYYPIGNQNIRGAARLAASLAKDGDSLAAYGLTRDIFCFYDSRIAAVTSVPKLKELMAESTGDIYLMYGWRYAYRGHNDEFAFIDRNFEVVRRFDGMLMDSVQQDGEVVLMVSRKETRHALASAARAPSSFD